MSKVLIALQFWGDRKTGDWSAANTLARFIADLQPTRSSTVEFLFVCRFDSSIDEETRAYVANKFPTHVHTCRRVGAVGHPYGCNELWADTIQEVYHRSLTGRLFDVDSVITLEADCAPLTPDWADRIHAEWLSVGKPAALGAWSPVAYQHSPPGLGHINGGSSIYPIDLSCRVPSVFGCPANHAWDVYHARALSEEGWHKSKLVLNWYKETRVSEERVREAARSGAVLIHGVKDDSAFEHAKKLLVSTV